MQAPFSAPKISSTSVFKCLHAVLRGLAPRELIRWHTARVISSVLTLSLLSASMPTAPAQGRQVLSTLVQDGSFWFYSNGWDSSLKRLLKRESTAARPILEKQADRNRLISRIQIYPGEIATRVGQPINFSAVAYDSRDVPIGGIRFDWRCEPFKNQRARISPQGEFLAEDSGLYTVYAAASGRKGSVTITVTRDLKASRVSNAHAPATIDEPNDWNNDNAGSAFQPGNRRGNPPNVPNVDGGSSSGNFQIVAPVLSLPGRGLNVNLSLTYNSRIWNKAGAEVKFDINRDSPAAGWSTGFGKVVNMGDAGDMLVDADGTRHTFAGTRTFYPGFNQYRTDLHTTDGTFIKYGMTHQCWETRPCDSMAGYAYYPDGRVVTFGVSDRDNAAYPTLIRDRNDNYITITYAYHNFADPQIQTITDTMGRVILFHYDRDNPRLLTCITAAGLPDANGNPVNHTLVRLHYRDLNLLQNNSYGFSPTVTPVVRSDTIKVIDAIYYPAIGSGYWFGDPDSYSSYGMIRKVIEQRGMAFTTSTSDPLTEQGNVSAGTMSDSKVYNYPLTPDNTLADAPTYTTMSESWDSMDVPGQVVTHYLVDNSANPRTTKITGPDGNYFVQNAYNYPSLPLDDPLKFKDGLVYETKLYNASNTLLMTTSVDWEKGDFDSPRAHRVEITDEIGLKIAAEANYGPYNQITELREFGYNATTPRRIKRMQYDDVLPYKYVVNIPKLEEIYTGDGNTRLSRTEYYHDIVYVPFITSPYEDHPVVHNSRSEASNRNDGNINRIIRYADAAGPSNPITEKFEYDMVGNVIKQTKLCSNGTVVCTQTSFTFNRDTQWAYPVATITGSSDPNSGAQVVTTMAYDYNTGLPRFKTDANQRTAELQYSTETWRPTKVILSTGASMTFDYNDAGLSLTKTMLNDSGALAGQNTTRQNGRGQVRRNEALSGPNIWDVVEVKYDSMGRVWQESNPFRSGANQNEIKWSENFYDALGRVFKYRQPDGSLLELAFNETTRPQSASSDPGHTIRSKDAWNRERWARLDADDQIVEVIEPNANGGGSVAAGGYLTTYSYDVRNLLVGVTQGDQQRTFHYDSLGRLTHQKLAEAEATLDNNGIRVGNGTWSDVFSYDELSNLISHIDARGVKTSFSYRNANNQLDLLNRLHSVTYDTQGAGNVLAAPSSTYGYMPTGDVTRILSINTTDVGAESFEYDVEGRLKERMMTFAGHLSSPMKVKFLYDSFNRVTDTYYPDQYAAANASRKILHRDYDVGSRLSGFKVDQTDYASQFVYNPASQVESLKVGPGGPNQITRNHQYGAETGLLEHQTVVRGSGQSATTLLDLTYDYLRPGTTSGRTGQLTRVYNNLNHNRDRGYSYDALGRLAQATGGPSASPLWTQTYGYDNYGNRTSVVASGHSAQLLKDQDSQSATSKQQLAKSTGPNSRTYLQTEYLAKNKSIELPDFLRAGDDQAISDSSLALFNPLAATPPHSGPSIFTDDPLQPNVTTIQALHITELRDAVNQLRGRAGLPAVNWTLPVAPGGLITAAPIVELRAKLDDALLALGLATGGYSAGLSTNLNVRAVHIQELRDRVKAAWNTSAAIPSDGRATLSYNLATNRITTTGFSYDASGNLTHIIRPNGSGQSLQYDAAGRLVKIRDDNNQTLVTYTYNHGRQRLITQTGNESSNDRTYYVWGAQGVVAEYMTGAQLPNPVWSKNYIYLGGSLLATQESVAGTESVQFHHSDRLQTRIITDPLTGAASEQATLAFGTTLSAESTAGTNRPFAGYDRSAVSGLDYAVNRHYDSFQGRFTTVDPLGMSAANLMDPQSLNLYAYCGNDPVNCLDPKGTSWFSWISSFGGSSERRSGSSGIFGGLFSFALGLLGSLFRSPPHILGRPFISGLPAPTPTAPPPPPITTTISYTGPQDWQTAMTALEKGLQRLDKLGALAKGLLQSGKVNLPAAATEMALKLLFGDVWFHAGGLNATEVEFAKELSAFEGRSFQGYNAPGMDGVLHDGRTPTSNPRPVELQQNSQGGMRRIIHDAEEHQDSMKTAGIKHMALYIKYTGGDLTVDSVMKYLYDDGFERGLVGMTDRGIIDEITIFTQNGVVRINRGHVLSMQHKK